MDKLRSRRWLWNGAGALAQHSLTDWGSSRILTNNPKDEEEWDKFDGEQDGHRVKCETAIEGVSAGPIWVDQCGRLTVRAWTSKPSSNR